MQDRVIVRDFNWLETQINAASAEVASWPAWKSQGSTKSLVRGSTRTQQEQQETKPASFEPASVARVGE
jgi:hypothetical protein